MLKGPHHSKFRATTFSFFNATGSNRTEARFKPNVLACNYHTLTLEFVLFVDGLFLSRRRRCLVGTTCLTSKNNSMFSFLFLSNISRYVGNLCRLEMHQMRGKKAIIFDKR